jgi:hypothetical protein
MRAIRDRLMIWVLSRDDEYLRERCLTGRAETGGHGAPDKPETRNPPCFQY